MSISAGADWRNVDVGNVNSLIQLLWEVIPGEDQITTLVTMAVWVSVVPKTTAYQRCKCQVNQTRKMSTHPSKPFLDGFRDPSQLAKLTHCCCCCMPFSTILVVNPGSPGLESSVLVSS